MGASSIRRAFEREFWPVAGKFDQIVLPFPVNVDPLDLRAARAGVYVWLSGGRVIKIGRSFSNARKRALEHVRDNTGGVMGEMMTDTQLLLFTVDEEDCHWPAALEVYLERVLDPVVKSKRQG